MKRMLFNATHSEELRVAIVDGQRLVDLDIETAGREQRKSNIYKGVVTRVEPSLEACFVNYGEERHGFLPFKEIAREYFRPGVDVGRATIKEAIAEGTELLVQVEKEERGNKGAALTTFVSLAGRYLVLMPNNPRGGGVSRRIEGEDRQELKEAMDQLEVPGGMSLIARTAGIGRTVDELQWDLNYLLQLWKAVDDAKGLQAGAYLIYQESSLVIRAIRDYFHPDIGEILIDTDDVYEQARQFMLHVMPDMSPRVKRYRDDVPLFSRFQIEHQIETAYSRTVQLPSGGALVIDHTEALVAVDVNSARSTRGSDIEETALRTNLEAADEVGRQLRLRDLGGLIVIDFIDMESTKAQREVEQRLRDALHHDRARVQMGKISRFGLMELSRQRLRPALNEGSHMACPRCNGTGVIRDTDSSALHILRILQEESMKDNTAAVYAQVPVEVASYLLNEKRTDIAKLEARLKVTIVLIPNKHLETPNYKIERLRHDDPRLEDVKASYDLVDQPTTDSPYLEAKEEPVKPRQEAVVKGITPSGPAPIAAPRPERHSAASQPAKPATGLWASIVAFFKGPDASQAAPAPAPKPQSEGRSGSGSGRGGRQGDGRRNGRNGRGGDRSENRDRAENRERSEPREAKDGRPAREPREPREPRESREPKESQTKTSEDNRNAQAGREGGREGGRSRGGRGGRNQREGQAELLPQETDSEIVQAAPTDSADESANAEGTGRRRRRRRSSKRGDGEGSDAVEATGNATETQPDSQTAAQPQLEPALA
ncbi:MAG: Rne/Rng family ribonuclease, partial [Burkholderiaceae bacterium]